MNSGVYDFGLVFTNHNTITLLLAMFYVFSSRANSLKIFYSIAMAIAINCFLKDIYKVPPHFQGSISYAFPSGHLLTGGLLYSMLALYLRSLTLVLISLVALIYAAICTEANSFHTYYEMIIGALIGLSISILLFSFDQKFKLSQYSFGLLTLTVAVTVGLLMLFRDWNRYGFMLEEVVLAVSLLLISWYRSWYLKFAMIIVPIIVYCISNKFQGLLGFSINNAIFALPKAVFIKSVLDTSRYWYLKYIK